MSFSAQDLAGPQTASQPSTQPGTSPAPNASAFSVQDLGGTPAQSAPPVTPPVESMTDRWAREAYETVGKMLPQATTGPAMQQVKHYAIDNFQRAAQEGGNIAEHSVNNFFGAWDRAEAEANGEKAPAYAKGLETQYYAQKAQQENPVGTGVIAGLSNLGGQIVADPRNWPFLAKSIAGRVGTVAASELAPWAEKLMSKGFGVQMTAGVADQLGELKKNWATMDPHDKSKAITQLIAGTYLAQSAVREGFKGEAKPATPTTVGPEAGGEGPKTATKTGTEAGEKTTLRPTTRTTAGVEAPVSAKAAATLEGQKPSLVYRAADLLTTPGKETQFAREETRPAATRQAQSTLGQVAEDRIDNHQAVVNGENAPEPITGTQQVSRFTTPDEAWQEMQQTAKDTTFKTADDISQREQQEWQAKKDQAVQEYKDLVDRHNANIDDYNKQVPKDQRMPHAEMNPEEVAVPERPQSYNELRADVQKEQANAKSADAAIREEALKTGLPKAEKAIDGWFKEHSDEISPAEYDSVKKLWADSERFKEIAMKIRGPLTQNNLTGNNMRQIEVSMNNQQIRRGQSPDAFQRLLGPDGYNNWQNVAKLFDTVKDPSLGEQFKSWGEYGLKYLSNALFPVLHAAGIWGLATAGIEAVGEKLANHILFDPEFGSTFNGVVDWLKSRQGVMAQSITELPGQLRDKLMSIIQSYKDAGERGAAGATVKQGRKPQLEKFGRKGVGAAPAPTPEETQAVAHHENGGSTFSPEGENLNGQDRYSVGAYPDRTQQMSSLTPQVLRDFKSVNSDVLSQPDHAVGTWKDADTGKHVLDVTKLYGDRDEAVAAGKAANQKAIYHLGGEGEIPTGGTGEKPTLTAHHWSGEPNLTETNPEKMGTGVRGAERARMNEPGFIKRTNFGLEGYKEPAVQSKPYHYVSDLDASKYYDAREDADGIWQKGFQEGGATGAEQAVRDAGYHGYRSGNEVASFEKVAVRPVEAPRAEPPQPVVIHRQLSNIHEVVTGSTEHGAGHLGHLVAYDMPAKEGELSTEVRVGSHWVDPELRGKGVGTAQIETLAQSLAESGKTALLSDTKMTDAAKGAWKRLMSNYPIAVTEEADGGYRFDLDKLKSPAVTKTTAQVKGSTVELMNNPLKVKKAGGATNPSTIDVAKALNQYTKRNLGGLQPGSEPAEMVERAKSIAEDEARYQMAQNNSGTTWYTEQMDEHDAVAKEMRPELKDDTKLSLFKFAEAILSSGQKPYRNFTATMEAWDHYARDGKFPINNPATDKSWGPRGVAAYGNAFEAVNRLVEERGEKGAVDWMMSEHPVSELKQYNKNVAGKKTDLQAGVQILGAKRGPFAQNLHGQETAFTADMWVSRTWNRWMGSIETDPASGEVTSDAPRNGQERALMKQSFSEVADKLKLTTSSLQAVLWYYEQALYTAHGTPKESWSFSDAARRAQSEEKAKAPETMPEPTAKPENQFGPKPGEEARRNRDVAFNPADFE